jgi:hypothetical protein
MAMDTKAADSSVVMALSELVRMENDRIDSDRDREQQRLADARAERERAEAAASEAERQRTERAAQEARVAEAEARLRVEADRERDQRVAAMRAELARVEADRQALRANIEERIAPREPTRANGWALAFGLSSLVAASLAGLLVMQQGAREPLPTAPNVAPIVVVAAPTVPDVAPVVEAPAPEVQEIATAPTAPVHHGHLTHAHVDHQSTERGTELIGLDPDDGSDDVLGHLAEEAHRPVRH